MSTVISAPLTYVCLDFTFSNIQETSTTLKCLQIFEDVYFTQTSTQLTHVCLDFIYFTYILKKRKLISLKKRIKSPRCFVRTRIVAFTILRALAIYSKINK